MAMATVLQPTLSDSLKLKADTTYSANLDDIVAKHLTKEHEDVGQRLLMVKMLEILRNMQYDDAALRIVASRVASNLFYRIESYSMAQNFAQDISLANLSDESHVGCINSNEPVLLVGIPPEHFTAVPSTVQSLKATIIERLRERNIRPVRVYTRIVSEPKSLETGSIGILLLNVVNTDIGGPSMVQLLDAAFHDSSWSQYLTSKEAFNGNELLWRGEHWPNVPNSPTSVPPEAESTGLHSPPIDAVTDPVMEDGPLLSGSGSSEWLPEVHDHDADEGEGDGTSFSKAEDDGEAVHHDIVNEQDIEHPEWTALRTREIAKADIRHPTWSHESEPVSLLDLITTQSAHVQDNEPLSIITGDPAESKVDSPGLQSASAEDDFEIVDPQR